MDIETRKTLVARYKDGYRAVADALAGATDAELDARPAPGKWASREATAELLDRLTEAEWAREGTHTEHGRYGMDTWLNIYSAHAHDHADQIRRARASLKRG